MSNWARRILLLGLFGLGGCGGAGQGAAFSPDWQSDGGRGISGVVARVGKVTLPEGRGLAVGVTERGLVAVGLDGSGKWTHAGALDSRPSIAGNVVVFTGGGDLIALDAATGKTLWKTPAADRRLRGAGDDGQITVASLGSADGGGTVLLVIDRSGRVLQRWTPEVDVGIPAVASGVVFAPWGNQYVSALDTGNGSELGRVLGRTVMSRALAVGGSLYFGQNAFVRFDDAIVRAATNAAHTVALPDRELPGKPVWFPDGTAVLPPGAGAPDSIRFYARPVAKGDKVALDSERFAATYFRIVVGFHSVEGSLRWVRTLPAEVIGGDAAAGGYAFCDVDGNVWLTDARAGGDSGKVSLGEPVRACIVNGGNHRLSPGKDSGTAVEQLSEAVSLREAQMATIQRFLLRELGTNEDPGVTKTLLELASDARTQPDLLEESRQLLAARRTGVEYMLEALGRHYDFLSDVLRPPPVGPLADALAAAGEKRAAPLLAVHLNDPADSADDVRRTARALVTLASGAELDEVRNFFSLYRAAAEGDELVEAVLDTAKILVQLGGPAGKELVERASVDPLTHPAVRMGLANLVPKSG